MGHTITEGILRIITGRRGERDYSLGNLICSLNCTRISTFIFREQHLDQSPDDRRCAEVEAVGGGGGTGEGGGASDWNLCNDWLQDLSPCSNTQDVSPLFFFFFFLKDERERSPLGCSAAQMLTSFLLREIS